MSGDDDIGFWCLEIQPWLENHTCTQCLDVYSVLAFFPGLQCKVLAIPQGAKLQSLTYHILVEYLLLMCVSRSKNNETW